MVVHEGESESQFEECLDAEIGEEEEKEKGGLLSKVGWSWRDCRGGFGCLFCDCY